MTSYNYIDSLKELLSSIDVNQTLNDELLLTYINQARADVERLTMRLYPERYGDIWNTYITPLTTTKSNIGNNRKSNSTVFIIPLTTDFIDIYECIFYWNIGSISYQAQGRKVIKQEFYSILSNSFLNGQVQSPIYCEEVLNGVKNLYVTGFDIQNGTLLDRMPEGNETINVEIYYLKAINDMDLYVTGAADVEYYIPDMFLNMVTDIAAIYALNTNPIKESLEVMIQSKMKDIGIDYETSKLKAQELLPTQQQI
jgi:hypothetical protein